MKFGFGEWIGLLGIATGYYFFVKGKQKRGPWYCVFPYPARLVKVNRRELRGLDISYNGEPIPHADLTVNTVVFGNSGSIAIRRNDVLSPVTFSLPPTCKILEATLEVISRDVCGFSIMVNPEAQNELIVDFEAVDKADGLRVQLIHSGDPRAKVIVSTEILESTLSVRHLQDLMAGRWTRRALGALPYLQFTLFMLAYFTYRKSFHPRDFRDDYRVVGLITSANLLLTAVLRNFFFSDTWQSFIKSQHIPKPGIRRDIDLVG